MKSEIDTYRECVEHLMSARSSKLVSNGMPQHAAVLFEVFFKHAAQSVKIFCHHLDRDVFDQPRVIEAAADALKRGVALDIMVQKTPESIEFIERLSALDEKESMRLELMPNASEISPIIAALPQNFAIMDNRAYRLERNSKEMKATASMNSSELAGGLANLFNLLRANYVTSQKQRSSVALASA